MPHWEQNAGIHSLDGRTPWVRIVPYYAGNSLIISGPAAAVEELLDIIT